LNPQTAIATPSPPPAVTPVEVRYSLPELLRELEQERSSQAFAMEKLDQAEITKLFKKTRARRALKPRQ
jgi:hypothetical protein